MSVEQLQTKNEDAGGQSRSTVGLGTVRICATALEGDHCCMPSSAFDALITELERAQQSEREGWRYADELEQERKRLQARVDALMLEYCPDEMTPEQIAEWERHQQAVPNGGNQGLTRLLRGSPLHCRVMPILTGDEDAK